MFIACNYYNTCKMAKTFFMIQTGGFQSNIAISSLCNLGHTGNELLTKFDQELEHYKSG